MTRNRTPTLNPAAFLNDHLEIFTEGPLPGPVLDLACGDGRNGVFLAVKGLPVVCCDRSRESLEQARRLADRNGVAVRLWRVDLEGEREDPLPVDVYGGILVFRYLHRPLLPNIREALREDGVLMYETFTVEQLRFGRPHNPDFLLRRGELREWFKDWEVIEYFEGIRSDPDRAVAQILCRKPAARPLLRPEVKGQR